MESPSNKVTAATLAAAFTTILLWLVGFVWKDVEISEGVAVAVTTVLTLLAGYFVPEGNPSSSARAVIDAEH